MTISSVHALDRWLVAVPRRVQRVAVTLTVISMVWVCLPFVPRAYIDFSHVPLLTSIPQEENYGTDSISDSYGAKVILNDISDMYTKERLAQTPLEARTWSKEASAPYPPVVLLAETGLYVLGTWTGVGFYGMILGLACLFLALSLRYFLDTRWYLFPVLYLNFSYFGYRFVYVQDSTYIVMLATCIAALWLARGRHHACHALMAIATTMKLSPLYYAKNVFTMTRGMATLFVAILLAGLVLPYFIWDNYLYIYRYGNELKGDWMSALGALTVAVPFAVVLWYVETRLDFDLEDRVGWGLVPFAMFLGLKMNVARHLLIVLLVPDKRGMRNLAAAGAMIVPTLLPGLVRFNSALSIATGLLVLGLVYYLDEIGWDTVRDDVRHPARTMRMMLAGPTGAR
ncbi:MAG TPA: hypothetical protein VIY56_01960 [Vicinamibacterales bacterium]